MRNFLGRFFLCFGGQKKKFKNFFKNIVVSALQSCIKWSQFFFLLDLIIQFKLELSPQNIHNESLPCIFADHHRKGLLGICYNGYPKEYFKSISELRLPYLGSELKINSANRGRILIEKFAREGCVKYIYSLLCYNSNRNESWL